MMIMMMVMTHDYDDDYLDDNNDGNNNNNNDNMMKITMFTVIKRTKYFSRTEYDNTYLTLCSAGVSCIELRNKQATTIPGGKEAPSASKSAELHIFLASSLQSL